MYERWRVKVKVEARLTSRLTLTRMRESKHRVYGTRANVNLYHVTTFSIYLSFTVHTCTKIGRFTTIQSLTIVFICSFLILKISQLESHVCRERDAYSLYCLLSFSQN